jgi:hypothetical protein
MSQQTVHKSTRRQAWVRWPCNPDGQGDADSASAFQFCTTKVLGLSAHEISFVLKQRPALNTLLAVQLALPDRITESLLARVKYTRPTERTSWIVRGEFLKPLRDAELQDLQ